MDLKKRVLLGLGWSAGAKFLSQLITWSITIIVIRLLSPEDYGLMALAEVLISFLMLLNEFGLGAALVQRKNLDELTIRQIFGLLIVINSILFLLLCLGAPLFAWFFAEQRIVPIIRLLSLQFIMMGFTTIPHSFILRNMDFRRLSVVDFTSTIVGSITTLTLAIKGWGVWSLVWGSLTISMVRTIGLNVFFPYFHTPYFSFKGMRKIFSFCIYIIGDRILWFLYSRADILIIGKLLGRELLGFYSVAMHLASLPMDKSSGIINQVAFPAFSSIQNEIQKARAHFLKAVRLISFFAFPLLWGMSSIAPEIIKILLGDKWVVATIPFQILTIVIPIRMVSNLMAPASIGLGRPDIPFLNAFLTLLVMPLAILFGTRWGIFGVSLAWLIFFPVVFLFNLYRFVPVLKIKVLDILTAMARPLIAALIMYAVITAIRVIFETDPKAIGHLILIIISGIIVFIGMIVLLNREGCREVLRLIRN